jgi:hypothetical protein
VISAAVAYSRDRKEMDGDVLRLFRVGLFHWWGKGLPRFS